MKKKIINGILMVALVAATATSFVSCKDNSEDVRNDLIAEMGKQAKDLKAAWQKDDADLNAAITAAYQNADTEVQRLAKEYTDAREAAVKDWVNGEGYLKRTEFNDSLTNNDAFKAVVEKLNKAADDITGLQDKVNDPEKGIDAINNQLDEIEDQIDEIVETLKNLVTSVTVNATANSILSNSKVFPGLDVQFVGAAYGEPDVKKGTFPSDFVDADLVNVTEGKEYSWTDGDFINSTEDEFDAGKIYFTLNPSNIDPNMVKLSLVNSLQTELFKIGEVTESKEKALNWGLTRGETYDAVVYEAPVTYDATTLKAIELKNVIDIKAIAKNVKNIINEAKGAAKDVNRSNYKDVTKATGKAVLKEAAQAVANLVNINMPYMPAVALKATWSDLVGTRSVLSDYSIAATAYKPMSFKEFDGVDFSGYAISFDKVDNAALRIVNKIKNELKKFDLTKVYITLDLDDLKSTSKDYTKSVVLQFKTNAGNQIESIELKTTPDAGATPYAGGATVANKTYYSTTSINLGTDIDAILEAIENGVPADDINDMIAQVQNTINRISDTADRAAKFEDRVTDYLEYLIQRVLTNANRALEPILLVDGSNGMQRATGTYQAGTHTFVPTTVTYELVAPAFQKYIAVCGADGKARWGKVLAKGQAGFNKVDVPLQVGDTKVVYSALDFKGNTITKVYSINVK